MTQRDPQDERGGGRLREVAADATGFGAAELRMTRDLILHPRRVVTEQTAPGSPYPKPLRYYLTFNGLFLLLIGMLGGFEGRLSLVEAEALAPFVAESGKSLDSFMADLDQWYSILVVPLVALSFYPVLRFLFGRWSIHDRTAQGQAFTFMSGWTLWGAPFGLAAALSPMASLTSLALGPLLLILLFFRMGRDVWWRNAGEFVLRFLALFVLVHIAMLLAGLLSMVLAVIGATYAP